MVSRGQLVASVFAVATHAALLVAVAHVRPIPRENAAIDAPAEVREVETVSDDERVPPSPAVVPERPEPRAPSHAVGAAFPSSPDVVTSEAAPDVDFAISTTKHLAPAAINLGVGSYWKSVAGSPTTNGDGDRTMAGIAADATPVPSFDEMMRSARDARDRDLGLGAGGALVTAAHQALSVAHAPDVGSASFDFECDAGGNVTEGRVVPPAPPEWEDVRREILRLMAGRKVHVPAGSNGTRVRLSIVAERVSPTGKVKPTAALGALPDDMAGGDPDGGVCEGEGWSRKCTGGWPLGATITGADVVNLATNAVRIVRVKILGETTL